MTTNIKSVFDDACKHLRIDNKLVKAIALYERNFVNSSQDHIEFLGGALLGTPPLRFHNTDRNAWFDDIMQVDDVLLRNELHSLPTIDPTHKVASDVFNLSMAWMLHALYTSNTLSASQKQEAMINVVMIMHYRFLSSLMSHYFKYEPNREFAEATYNALNYKYALKAKGSWAKLIESRAQDTVSRNNIHFRTIERFDNDDAIKYLITDTQGRIREVVKKMYKVFIQVMQSGVRVSSKSSTVNLDGEIHLRDLVRRTSQYKRYAQSVLVNRATLIRPELVKIIVDAQHTMPERHLLSTLEYMADNGSNRGDRKIMELIDETVVHTLEFINDNRSEFNRSLNLATLLSRLRSLYMSSRSTDRSLLKMRDLSLDIVKRSVRSNNASLLSSIRTGVMLYIVLRTFTMDYYSSGASLESNSKKVAQMLLEELDKEESTTASLYDSNFM